MYKNQSWFFNILPNYTLFHVSIKRKIYLNFSIDMLNLWTFMTIARITLNPVLKYKILIKRFHSYSLYTELYIGNWYFLLLFVSDWIAISNECFYESFPPQKRIILNRNGKTFTRPKVIFKVNTLKIGLRVRLPKYHFSTMVHFCTCILLTNLTIATETKVK